MSEHTDIFDLTEADFSTLPPDFKPTPAFRTILERVSYAIEASVPIGLITGAHGAGKTTTLRFIAGNQDALFWEARPGYKPKHLLNDIAMKLGINAGTGWAMATTIVVEQLVANPRTFLIDEAQRLDYGGLDLIKFLADQSGSTFLLSASPSLEARIDRWPDISSRTSIRIHVAPLQLAEFCELYRADGFTQEALVEIHKATGGVMRSIVALIKDLDVHLLTFASTAGNAPGRGDLLPGHIRRIAEKVIG